MSNNCELRRVEQLVKCTSPFPLLLLVIVDQDGGLMHFSCAATRQPDGIAVPYQEVCECTFSASRNSSRKLPLSA